MKKLVLALLLTAFSLQAKASEIIVIKSANLHCNDTVQVFIPTKYAANYAPEYCAECCGDPESVPALYLLHGWSGCWRNWGDKFDLQAVADQYGFIIICPDGFYNSWYVNDNDPMKMQWRDFFDKELYPQMKEKFYLDPEKTFISGLSMGGHGAINIFLDDISRFKAAGSMSGVLDLAYTTRKDHWITSVIGPYNNGANKRFATESAHNRIAAAKGSGKLMLVTCGYNDSLLGASTSFTDQCRKDGVDFIEVLSPGKHSWTYWGYALHLHLWYFTRILNGENLGY